MNLMSLNVFLKNQDVIKIDEHKLIYHVPENVINERLEYRRCVREAERHYQVLPVSGRRIKRRLPLIPFPYTHQMVGISKIQFCKDGGPLQEVEGRIHERQGVMILNRDLVDTPVVDARP